MKTYLVGGAVRDRLLNFPVRERDWVVVGSTTEEMLNLNYRPVGKDFPVFLHPETNEEYALARTERKTAPGYKGFSVHASPEVTLEQDLLRRDLTINAIAEDEHGVLFDPYNGKADLDARLLRHVSPAFAEDPVRILRVARFAARYEHLGFKVADETMQLMQDMTAQGEVDALVAERVWAELYKALGERSPQQFIMVLRECGALQRLLPELDRLFGVPQPKRYHPEIDTGVHVLMVLEQATRLSDDPLVRFAALMHDIGKGVTPPEIWPSHRGHEDAGDKLFTLLAQRLRIPERFQRLASKVIRFHTHCHHALELKPSTLVDTLQNLDAFRNHSELELFLQSCLADARGRTGFENCDYPQADLFRQAQQAALSVDVKAIVDLGLKGAAIGEELRKRRIAKVRSILPEFKAAHA